MSHLLGFFAPWIISALVLDAVLPARRIEGYACDEVSGSNLLPTTAGATRTG